MIQRIQSVYLILAMGLMISVLFLPFAEIITGGGAVLSFKAKGLLDCSPDPARTILASWPVYLLTLIICLLLFFSIYLFKNRRLQMRFCIYIIILQLGWLGLVYYYVAAVFRQVEIVEYAYHIAVILPLIALIITWLAFRAIRKDEILIRSINKIR